ncbi:MAG TPA: hypothetical protein VGK42_10675 [Candidatus Dormibacteraeota bacterium]
MTPGEIADLLDSSGHGFASTPDAHHNSNHLRQALANVEAYVWQRMGNAQRFSATD